jgi:hypothetical protein
VATVWVWIVILTVWITLSVYPFNRMAHTANIGFKQIWPGRIPLVDSICKADINFVSGCRPWWTKPRSISRYLTRYLYNASLSYVMASTTLINGQ